MPLTLISTLSGETSNSYVDVAFCEDYWQNHHDQTKAAKWQALSSSQKVTLLLSACRVIESARFTYPWSRTWSGSYRFNRQTGTVIEYVDYNRPKRYWQYQALQFPRNVDRYVDTGVLYIPEPVQWSQCEQAVYMISFDESVVSNRMQGIEKDEVEIGPIKTSQTFSGGTGTLFSPVAKEFLSPYFVRVKTTVGRA